MCPLDSFIASSLSQPFLVKNLEEKHALRIQLEGTVEDLWRQFQQVLGTCVVATITSSIVYKDS